VSECEDCSDSSCINCLCDEQAIQIVRLKRRIAAARALARKWIDEPDSAMSDGLGAELLEALE
jgi:hypothetical protein